MSGHGRQYQRQQRKGQDRQVFAPVPGLAGKEEEQMRAITRKWT